MTRGSVALLVVLYSINVFITFSLSQLGMVRHWWKERQVEPAWKKKLAVNGIGLLLTGFILISLSTVKFHQGGWMTLLATASLVAAAFAIKRHYARVSEQLRRLDEIMPAANVPAQTTTVPDAAACDPKAKTAVLFVNGFNGLGLHTVLNAMRLFGGAFKNFVFVQVGVVDAGNFKGAAEIERLRAHLRTECERYVNYLRAQGYAAAAFTPIGPDAVEEIAKLTPAITAQYSNAVFFGGQLLFERI